MAAGRWSTAEPIADGDAAAAAAPQIRHHPNPLISVGDLQKCIEKFIREDRNENRDIFGWLVPIAQASLTWKTAPRPDLLLLVKPLLMRMLVVCTNGCAPGLKLEKALKAVDDDKKANFSSKAQEVWASAVSTMIRIMFSNLRDVKHIAEVRRRCFQKAGVAEADAINVLLEIVHADQGEAAEVVPRSHSAPPGPRSRGQGRGEVLRAQSADGLGLGDGGVQRTPRRATTTRALAERGRSPGSEVSDVDLPSAFKRVAGDMGICTDAEDLEGLEGQSLCDFAPPLMQPMGISGQDWDMLQHVQQLEPVRPPRKRKVMKATPMKATKVTPMKTAPITPMKATKVTPMKTAMKTAMKSTVTPKKTAMKVTPMKSKITPMKSKVTPPETGQKVTPMKSKVTERKNNKPESVEEQQQFKDEGFGCPKDRWLGHCSDCKAKRAAAALSR